MKSLKMKPRDIRVTLSEDDWELLREALGDHINWLLDRYPDYEKETKKLSRLDARLRKAFYAAQDEVFVKRSTRFDHRSVRSFARRIVNKADGDHDKAFEIFDQLNDLMTDMLLEHVQRK